MKMQNTETHFTSVPAFLSKLWALVDDPSTNDLIYWDEVSAKNGAILKSHFHIQLNLLSFIYDTHF